MMEAMLVDTGVNGVRTTGIYCRAGCPASPAARNVSRYSSGVAAEAAGFRPCLRCRPDRLAPANGVGRDLLGRALVLIAEGALDADTEVVLARRLGVSERHLRRLFLNHLGATPGFIARSRRAHFARRLLDETDLPMEALSLAAGFGSSRQMNRVVSATFRFTPTQLRAKRRDADRLVSDGGLRLRMPFIGALHFQAMLHFLGSGLIPGVESVSGSVYRRTIVACGHTGMIEVADGDASHLQITAHLPTFTGLIDDVGRCRRMFGLDQPAEAGEVLAADPILAPLIERRPGLRLAVGWDPFETAARIICERDALAASGEEIAGNLATRFGDRIEGLGAHGLVAVFPPAERIASTTVEQLAGAGLTRERAQTLWEFGKAYRIGRIRLDGSHSTEDCVGEMMGVPGVDSQLAHHIAMRGAGCLDAFPAADDSLRVAVGRLVGQSGPMTTEELAERASAWRPYRALAAMYLWITARSA